MRKDNRPSTLVEEAERLRSRAKMADDAVSTIATAAGLPADASAEEVVARVGEMHSALITVALLAHEAGAFRVGDLTPSAADSYAFALRLAAEDGEIVAEEAGRG